LNYSRHFSLLTAFGALTCVSSRFSFPASLSVAFALYGALHATALILSFHVPPPVGRSSLFIATAAILSATMFHLGLLGSHLSARMPGGAGLYVVLGFASVTGALSYGVCIRMFRLYRLKAATLAMISLGCVSASCLALFTLTVFPFLGPWWLAVLWWYALSGGLWFWDRRQPLSSLADRRSHMLGPHAEPQDLSRPAP
jgi:hypothetical protein